MEEKHLTLYNQNRNDNYHKLLNVHQTTIRKV